VFGLFCGLDKNLIRNWR